MSLCRPSRRRFATRACARPSRRCALCHRFDGRLAGAPVRADPAGQRGGPARRSVFGAPARCRGLATDLAGGQHRQVLDRRRPRRPPRPAGPGCRSAGRPRQENDTYQRPPSSCTVADRIRAVPASRRRASLRADSCSFDRAQPGQGHVRAVRLDADRAGGERAPTACSRRLVLNRGKPTGRPFALAGLGVRASSSSPRTRLSDAGGVRLLRVLRPPRRDRRPWPRSTPCAATAATTTRPGSARRPARP